MVNDATDDYATREVPFDEWADVDTLVHRAAVTSGDFDYTLRPLCSDCGGDLELEYEELPEGGAVLAALVCDTCRLIWRMAVDGDQQTA